MRTSSDFMLLFSILIAIPLTGAGIDLITPSLPYMQTAFSVNAHIIKNAIGIYLVGYSVGGIVFGIGSDYAGRRRLYLFGLLGYVIFSLLSILSLKINFFLFCRFLQGFFIGSVGAISRAILKDRFNGSELRKVIAYFTTAWSLGPIIAPFLGGYIQHYLGWRYHFVLFALIGLLSYILAFLYIPETYLNRSKFHFAHLKNNVIVIMKNKTFYSAILNLSIGYTLIVLFNVIAPFMIQQTLGYDAIFYGHIALIMGCAYFFGTLSYSMLLKHIHVNILVASAFLFILFAALVFVVIAMHGLLNLEAIVIPIFLILFSIGYIMPPASSLALSLFPEKSGLCSSLMGFSVSFFTGFSSIFAGLLKTESLIPVSVVYAVLIFAIFCNYFLILRKHIDHK